jgi:hypothetical protein
LAVHAGGGPPTLPILEITTIRGQTMRGLVDSVAAGTMVGLPTSMLKTGSAARILQIRSSQLPTCCGGKATNLPRAGYLQEPALQLQNSRDRVRITESLLAREACPAGAKSSTQWLTTSMKTSIWIWRSPFQTRARTEPATPHKIAINRFSLDLAIGLTSCPNSKWHIACLDRERGRSASASGECFRDGGSHGR